MHDAGLPSVTTRWFCGLKVIFISTCFVREYAPVKNSPESAIDKVKQGLDAHCASSGEADFYALHGDFLRCGRDVVIGGKEPGVYRGLSIEMPPRIVLSPSFALIEDDVIKSSKRGHSTQRSHFDSRGRRLGRARGRRH